MNCPITKSIWPFPFRQPWNPHISAKFAKVGRPYEGGWGSGWDYDWLLLCFVCFMTFVWQSLCSEAQ